MYNEIDMVRSLVILVIVLLAQASFGQIQEEKIEKPGPQKSIICLNKEQQDFDRAWNITLNYRNQCAKLTSLTLPLIVYSNVYCLNGFTENEAWVRYNLLDRRINPIIQTNSMAYSERYFFMMEPVSPLAFTMKTEIGINIPELSTDRLSSHIYSGIGYNMYYPQQYADYYYFPVSLSFFYNIFK